jgi:small GTP-binding protein
MSILNRIFGNREKTSKAKIVVLGPSKAGKTTFVKYLEQGKPVLEETRTTIGIDIRPNPIFIENWSFTIIDVGGQKLYQETFWNLGIQQAEAVIYLIDGLVRKENPGFNEALRQFKYMLNLIDNAVPLLILVNKQDLKEENPLTLEEASELFSLSELSGRSMNIIPTSAKYGDGVSTAIEWLIEKLEE